MAGKKSIMKNPQQRIQEKFRLGPGDDLPRFLGLNYRWGQHGELIVDHQHYIDSMEIPDLDQLVGKTKRDILNPDLQSIFRSLASKIDEFAQTVRPDIMYAAKYLSTRYGRATKSDMTQMVKLIKRVKSNIIIPNLGEPEDWILAGAVNSSHRTSGSASAVGGHFVMLINKYTKAASTIHWTSNKIEKEVHSSAAAETIAMQGMFDTVFFVRKVLEEILFDCDI